MKTNKDIKNEETIVDNAGKKDAPETAKANVTPEDKSKGKSQKSGANIAAGAAAGAAGGLGANLMMAFAMPGEVEMPADSQAQATVPTPGLTDNGFDGSEIPVSEKVDDSMSFSEAFAAARTDIGAGGVFKWHGNWYGTYYAGEWENVSDEYKNSFSSHAYTAPTSENNDQPEVVEVVDAGETEEVIIPEGVEIVDAGDESDEVEILGGVEFVETDAEPALIDSEPVEIVAVETDSVVAETGDAETGDAEACDNPANDNLADYINDAPIDEFVV